MSIHRIKLMCGGYFDFVDMHESVYTIESLAHNIAAVCRFNGSVAKHYSVGQHSYLVSLMVPPEHTLSGLCHDLSESVLSDLNSPAKALCPDYKKLEKKVEKEMFSRLGLKFPMHPCIKLADLGVLAAEIRDLQPQSSDWPAIADIEPWPKKIVPWSAAKAKKMWLERFYELTGANK